MSITSTISAAATKFGADRIAESIERFRKHARTAVHRAEPFNAGPPADLLARQPVTPSELFFVRNHAAVPAVDAEAYRLAIRGRVAHPLNLSLAELKARFARVTATAALQCAGLRRRELDAVRPIGNQVEWGAEPIGAAVWGGARLRDVLEAAQFYAEAQHVGLTGLDRVQRNGDAFGFGGSIPLHKALGEEVLLAYEMNGEPLEPAHGFPLRVVVPGYIGARSVKWVGEISVQDEPSSNYFQTNAYKVFPPEVTAESADWASAAPLGEILTNSAICEPRDGAAVAAGALMVRGWAIAQGARRVESVELVVDGVTRVAARFITPSQGWFWRLWEAPLALEAGAHEIAAVATDSAGYTQPAELAPLWNFKGYMNNAWHRVTVHAGRK